MSCPICLNDLTFSSSVLTVCGHVFCWECLYKWVIRSEEEQEGDYDDLDIDLSGDPLYVEVQMVAERRFKCPICKLGLVGIGNMGLMPMYADKQHGQQSSSAGGVQAPQTVEQQPRAELARSGSSSLQAPGGRAAGSGGKEVSAPPYRYLIAYYQRYIQVHFFGIESLDADDEQRFGSKLHSSASSSDLSHSTSSVGRVAASSSCASSSSSSFSSSDSSSQVPSSSLTFSAPSSSPPQRRLHSSSSPSPSSHLRHRPRPPSRYDDYINSFDAARSSLFGVAEETDPDDFAESFDETQYYVSRVLLFGGSLVVLLLVLELV